MQWVSTSDFCHRSAVFSYALNSTATDQSQWVSDFNHFVLFDTQSLIACHDFEYIDLMPVGTTLSARYHTASTSLLSSAPAHLMTAVKPASSLSAYILDRFGPFMFGRIPKASAVLPSSERQQAARTPTEVLARPTLCGAMAPGCT